MWMIIAVMSVLNFDQGKVDETYRSLKAEFQQPIRDDYRPPVKATFLGAIGYARAARSVGFDRASIIVGDVPAETLRISGYFFNEGDIIVINDGVLLIENADFNLAGNIMLVNHGQARADSSTLYFLQDYIYHRTMIISDSSKWEISDCETHFSGYPIGFWIGFWGEIKMRNVVNHDWITAGLSQHGRADLADVSTTGEWLYNDDCYARFERVDNFLSWFNFPGGSTADLTFPDGGLVDGFFVDSTLANISGIGYHVEIDSSTRCMWSTIPLRGSSVTVNNSELRVTGLMFQGTDTFDVSGLVNGIHYSDYVLPVGDRFFRLVNTSLATWNLYPTDTANVTVSSSIFGELCAYANSKVTIMNAYCDGTGGHIEAANNAFLIVGFSSVFGDIITKNRGLCYIAYCSMPMGNIWVTSASVMILVNTQFPEDPIPSDTAIVFVGAVTGPSNAVVDDTVAVQGSAWIDRGPYQSVDFGFYRMSYRLVGSSTWVPFGDSNIVEVRRSTLENWNTVGLAPGNYEVRLVLKDNLGDSVECSKNIALRPNEVEEAGNQALFDRFVTRAGPRCFFIQNPAAGRKTAFYDATGRLVDRTDRSTFYWTAPNAGIFFIRDMYKAHKLVAF